MNTKTQYFNRLCRTCMNEVEAPPYEGNTNSQQQWKSIFERIEECAALRIDELLSKAVAQIKVKQTDELPKQICCECLQTLLTAYRFQQMCIQSEERLLEMVAIKGADLKRDAVMESEVETAKPESSTFKNFCESSFLQNLQHSPIQESVIETTKQIIEPDIEQPNAAGNFQDNDPLLELCTDPTQYDYNGFVKNEPIDDDENHIDYSDSGTMHSVISVTKHEVFSIESEKKQVNVTSSPNKEGEYLSAHEIKANSKKSDHACELCGKKYSSHSNLKRHYTTALHR